MRLSDNSELEILALSVFNHIITNINQLSAAITRLYRQLEAAQ
jgi:hypothetical protein